MRKFNINPFLLPYFGNTNDFSDPLIDRIEKITISTYRDSFTNDIYTRVYIKGKYQNRDSFVNLTIIKNGWINFPAMDAFKDCIKKFSKQKEDELLSVKLATLVEIKNAILDKCILGKEKEEKMNKNEKLKNVDTIVITRDGNTVSAVAYDNCADGDMFKTRSSIEITYHVATAECGPNDIFDFNIGAKLAMDRLYEGYDMTPKPKRKPYNGKIFIECYPGQCLEDHHVYQVYNGLLPVVTKNTNPYIFCDMDDADLSFAIHKACFDHRVIKGSILALRTRAYFVKG